MTPEELEAIEARAKAATHSEAYDDVVAARQDIDALLAYVRELEAKVKELLPDAQLMQLRAGPFESRPATPEDDAKWKARKGQKL